MMAHRSSYLVTSTSPLLPLIKFFPTLSFPSLPLFTSPFPSPLQLTRVNTLDFIFTRSLLVFDLPKFSHVTPLHSTGFQSKLASPTIPWCFPTEQHDVLPRPTFRLAMLKHYTETRALRSATSGLLALPPVQEGSSRSALPLQTVSAK